MLWQQDSPVRVTRWRPLNLVLIAIWAVLALVVIAKDFAVVWPVTFALCAIAVYIVGADAMLRLLRPRS